MERVVITSLSQYEEATKDFNFDVCSLDTEVEREEGLNFYKQVLIGFSLCDGHRALYIDHASAPPLDKIDILRRLSSQLSGTSLLIFHNALFDLKVLHKNGVLIPKTVELFDTMIASHLLDENRTDKRLGGRGHGLKTLAQDILDADITKYDQAEKAGIHSALFHEYAQNDAIYTYQLCAFFKPRLEEQDLVKLFRNIEMPFVRALAVMEMNGILVDKERINELSKELRERATQLEIDMLKLIGAPYEIQMSLTLDMEVKTKVNFNSPKQLSNILNDLGIEVTERTKTGAPSVGKTTLLKLRDKHKFVELLYRYRVAQKLLTAFLEPLPSFIDPDGRVRSHYHNTGTVTGRLSSSNPNLQQIPKVNKVLPISTRSCFIASPGKKMISLDYSQQELRIMAEISRDEQLIHILNNGGDLHLINANLVFKLGIPQEYLYEKSEHYAGIKEKYAKDRDKGKVFSFGVPYGMGPHKLSRDFNVGLEEAEALLRNLFEGFPQLSTSIQKVHQEAQEKLFVVSFTGRRRHFAKNEWGKLDSKSLRQSFNFLIQGFGADLIRISCSRIQEFAEEHPQYGIALLATIHDEVLIECLEEHANTVADKCKHLMETAWTMETVPLVADYKIGDHFGATK